MKKEIVKNKAWILPLFILTLLAVNLVIVSAANEFWKGGFVSGGTDIVKNFFTSWGKGEVSANVAKIIFGVIIFAIVYIVLSTFVPKGEDSKYSVWLQIVSVGLAFLFTAYIAPSEIYSLLTSYTAVGMTLITLIPLATLGLFTYRAVTSGSVELIILQKLMWGLYLVYLGYRIILDWVFLKQGSGIVNIMVLGAGIIAAWVFIFNKAIKIYLIKSYIEANKDNAKKTFEMAGDYLERLYEAEKKAGKS